MIHMRRNKGLMLFVLWCVAHLAVQAQELKVQGRVLLASDSTAISGASVRLRDSGAATIVGIATDEAGAFALQADSKSVADLYVTMVGMRPVTISIKGAGQSTIDLGNIYMREDDTMLGDVVVEGHLKQIDREIVFPQPHMVQASPDVLSLLSNMSLPGLRIDLAHHTANIRGKGIYWMIDGVPKRLKDVRQLNPKSILRIEYSDLPTTRLIDRGQGGYINVILKERSDGGNIHTSLNSALWTGFAEAQVSGNYHQGKSDFTIDYSASYRDYPKWRRDKSQTFNIPDGTIKMEERGAERSPMFLLTHELNFIYIYRPDKQNVLSLTWRNGFGRQSYDIISQMSETGKEPYDRRSRSSYKGYSPVLDGYYQHIFDDGGKIEANLLGSLSMGDNHRDLTDKRDEEIIGIISNPIKNRDLSMVGEVNYQKLIHPKVYLSLGVQNSYAHAENTYLSDNYTDNLDRNNTYLYGQVSGRLSDSWQYSVGTGAKVLYTADNEDHRTFVRNQSSLALYYSLNSDWNFSLNSYFTPRLPSLAEISPVPQRFDHLIIYAGNPKLKPGTNLNNRLTASFQKGKFSSTLDFVYNHSFNPIYNHISYDTKQSAFVNQPHNGHFNSTAGVGLNMTLNQLFGFMTLVGNMGYNHYRSDVGNNPLVLKDFNWDLSMLLTYKSFSLAGYYVASPASLYNETITYPGDRAGITFMWSGDKLTLYAQMLYVGLPDGDSYKTQNFSTSAPYTETIVIPDNSNMLTLGLVWDFSFGKKRQRLQRGLYNYEKESSMVKVQY